MYKWCYQESLGKDWKTKGSIMFSIQLSPWSDIEVSKFLFFCSYIIKLKIVGFLHD